MNNFLQIVNYQNLDLMAVGIAIAAICILGFLVYQSDKESITNRTFLFFAFLTSLYGIFNYSSYKVTSPFLTLWLVRLTVFIAVWHAFSLYQFFYVFPNKKNQFSNKYKYVLIPLAIITSLLTLTPAIFSGINYNAGEVSRPTPGIAISLFGLVVVFFILGGIFQLFKKAMQSSGLIKEQLRFIFIGTLITFTLILTFNLLFPIFLNNTYLIPLAPLFVLPLIIATYYAVARYKLLNIKIVATEILTLLLAIAILFEVIVSSSILLALFRFIIFLVILTLGILLNRSVRKEVKQREQLEILTTELGLANEKLKTLDQARAEFITIASHQLRTPPATVKWYLSAILSGDYGKLTKKVSDQLKKTQNTNNHLISLIEDMLNVSRIERGKMEFLFEKTNIEELAGFAYEQLIPMAEDKNLKLSYIKPKKPLPEVMVDKEKLRQVMNNLIDNALKYTKIGTVVVSLLKEGNQIKFQVKDSGKGINTEEQGSIFQKYSRGKESVKQSAGLGLGLYVAKIIIAQHNGKIWAESEGEGKGSSFIFTIPIKNDLKATSLVDLTANQNQQTSTKAV